MTKSSKHEANLKIISTVFVVKEKRLTPVYFSESHIYGATYDVVSASRNSGKAMSQC